MDQGAGRFASAAAFDVIKMFMDPGKYSASTNLTRGRVYTKTEILQEFGYIAPSGTPVKYAGLTLQQYRYGLYDAD
jgi:hypothetical protein